MPVRRTVLASLAGLAVGGCVGRDRSRPSATDTPASTVTLVATEPSDIPAGSIVGLLPDAMSELRSAAPSAADTHAPVHGDHWDTLADFTCLSFEGTTYAVRTTGGTDAKEVLLLDRSDSDSECVTLAALDVADAHLATVESAHEGAGSATVSAATARALRDSPCEYVVVGTSWYELPSATQASETP